LATTFVLSFSSTNNANPSTYHFLVCVFSITDSSSHCFQIQFKEDNHIQMLVCLASLKVVFICHLIVRVSAFLSNTHFMIFSWSFSSNPTYNHFLIVSLLSQEEQVSKKVFCSS